MLKAEPQIIIDGRILLLKRIFDRVVMGNRNKIFCPRCRLVDCCVIFYKRNLCITWTEKKIPNIQRGVNIFQRIIFSLFTFVELVLVFQLELPFEIII